MPKEDSVTIKCFGCDALIEAADTDTAVDAFVIHGRECHTWTYPEEALRNYARNYGEAVERLTGSTARLAEIGRVTVHPVTEERVADCEQRVHETELCDAGIAVADVDSERLAEVFDRGLEIAGDEGDLAQTDHAPTVRVADQSRGGQLRLDRRVRPLRSPSAHARRHDGPSGPVSTGVARRAARRRADHQSVAASSASS